MYTIENEYLKVIISSKGAELQSISNKEYGIEYLWNGDPAFWAKRSPVLFPIVGTLKNDTYLYNDKTYHLGRHGFAREMGFSVSDQKSDSIRFSLQSDAGTLVNYPFEFTLSLQYAVIGEQLTLTYTVINRTNGDMYFSIGGHPAFRVPLVKGTAYADYHIHFDTDFTLDQWPLSKEGLIETSPIPSPVDSGVLPLAKSLFVKDALVYKRPLSSSVSLRSVKTVHGLDFSISGFPYLGIWAAKDADFVCIEPWCGIADSVDSNQQLIHKEGINKLDRDGIFERSWSARFY